MKTIQARTVAAFLIVAGSVIPAFGQGEGNRYGRSRDGGGRPQQQSQSRGENRQGGGQRDGGGQQFRQRESQPQYQQRQAPQYQQRQAPQYQQRQSSGYSQQQYQPQRQEQRYSQQQYRQQYRAPQYRAPQYQQQYRDNYRGSGSSYGFRGDSGMRWASRGGYRGQYIPNTRFYSSFGRQNYFRFGRPVYYNGYQRYSYGGFGFRIFDPIPAYWGDDWYDSDDVYVDYEDDGYYMYNRNYPGAGIAIGIDF